MNSIKNTPPVKMTRVVYRTYHCCSWAIGHAASFVMNAGVVENRWQHRTENFSVRHICQAQASKTRKHRPQVFGTTCQGIEPGLRFRSRKV